MKVNGACQCGNITISGEADPEQSSICHCTDCQKGSSSAFRMSIPMQGSTFHMTGQPATYLKTTADSGKPRLQAFCPTCGTPLYSTTPGEGVQSAYMVRVGLLQQRDQLMPRRQIWFRSAKSWLDKLATIPKFEKQS
jgi:hypothetical protein